MIIRTVKIYLSFREKTKNKNTRIRFQKSSKPIRRRAKVDITGHFIFHVFYFFFWEKSIRQHELDVVQPETKKKKDQMESDTTLKDVQRKFEEKKNSVEYYRSCIKVQEAELWMLIPNQLVQPQIEALEKEIERMKSGIKAFSNRLGELNDDEWDKGMEKRENAMKEKEA